MKVITFASIKGGVGKTNNTIITANNLAVRGRKVLVIDLDPNNSTTMFYTRGLEGINDNIEKHNIFEMFSHNNIPDNIIKSRIENIDIVPSHLNIFKLRSIPYGEMQKALQSLGESTYDYMIIDTSPNWDNILINALFISDIIITPLELNSDNMTTTKFLQRQILDECAGKINNWYLLISYWKTILETFASSMQSQFDALFEQEFQNILDIHIPKTDTVKNYIETDTKINTEIKDNMTKKLGAAYNKLVNMLEGLDGDDTTAYVKKF